MGDQLSKDISSLKGCVKSEDTILICEVLNEAIYVKHHKKKIAFLFSTMRHFARELHESGYRVSYTKLEDEQNSGFLKNEITRALKQQKFDKIVVTHPGEYRVKEDIKGWATDFSISIEIRADDRFLCSAEDFLIWAKPRKQLRMEYFYREMRKKYNVLMNGDQPIGGQWNYDLKNRKPPKENLLIPDPYYNQPDGITLDVMSLVAKYFPDHFGDLEPFYFGVTRMQALEALNLFLTQRLLSFGDYQDAMIEGEPWMYHSHISFYLNCGLLLPLECVRAAEKAYQTGKAPLNAVEGFIRQIIGWREFVRGVYWLKMPEYAKKTFLMPNVIFQNFTGQQAQK